VCGTGVSPSVDLTVAAQHAVAVCNVPAYGANSVAEHAIALAFAVARNIPQGDADIRQGRFPVRFGLELAGKTLGVVGAGSIGKRTLAIGRALGMRTLFWTRDPTPERATHLLAEYADLDDLFARSDVVSLHLPYLPETDGLIGERLLARLPDSAILINTARAGIVDGGALARLLASGRITGAGIDVFEMEPPSPDDPLLTAPNVVLSPHAAANTPDAIHRMVSVAIENLLRWTVGEPQNIVSSRPAA
jgi:phosphoglycerate dehydrogenase-like enzyme